jgi:RimJ/RimL family protein N-acetyltransferase
MALHPPLPYLPSPPPSDGDVVLRPLERRDAPALARIVADPDVTRYTYLEPGFSEGDARRWVATSRASWDSGLARVTVTDSTSADAIGVVGFEVDWRRASAEGFYWLSRQARGRGVMTRALRLLTAWAFETVGIERLFLIIEPVNTASKAVAARAGFRCEGVLRAYQPFKGTRPDFECWSRLPGDPPHQ